jgi:hypothetical protein
MCGDPLPDPGYREAVNHRRQDTSGEWAFLPDFEALMGKPGMEAVTTKPTMIPPLQWSENAMITP